MKAKSLYILLVFIYFNTSFTNVFGQDFKNAHNNIKFKHFSSKEGLRQSSVLDIFQDKKGYLWFATRDGLNKYDGNSFYTYIHNSEDKTSLSNGWVTSIFEDHYGNLWIGTMDGLNKFNTKYDNFKQFRYPKENFGNKEFEINDIVQIDSSSLWLSTSDGVYSFNIFDETFTNIIDENDDSYSLKDDQTKGLLVDNDGRIWMNSVSNIALFDPINKTFKHFDYPSTIKNSTYNNTSTLFEDSNGLIWLGYKYGLAYFDQQKQKFIQYLHKGKPKISSSTRSICEDDLGNLWIGTYIGLYILDRNNDVLTHFVHDEYNRTSLSQNSIYSIFKDSQGDIWIGTWAGGINYFDKGYNIFKQLSAGPKNNTLNYKVVSSIVERTNNELWIGTEGGGINIYHRDTGIFDFLTHKPNDSKTLSSNNVKSLIKDSDGNFWIGTHGKGINFLDTKSKPYRFKHFESGNKNLKLNEYRIISLLEDVNKNIWLGTSKNGLIFYDRKKKTFSRIVANDKRSINCIVQSKKTNILLLGGNNGFEKIDINSKKISRIECKNPKHESDISKSVNCIYEDTESNYWIGTEGEGLYFYNTSNEETTKYGIAQGLPNEVIYGILQDDNKTLWISTNRGLCSINMITKEVNKFDESNGLLSNEYNYGAYLKTSYGEIIFGGNNGIDYFKPDDLKKDSFIPPVDIYSIEVNNKPFLNITDSTTQIVLKYNQNHFNLNFVALSYSQSNKKKYAYKLEGFDTEWNFVENKNSATYTNLDDGDYIFKVKTLNDENVWSDKGDSISIKILPAPWLTWWAYTVYLIILFILMYYIRSTIVTRRLDKEELKKEKQEKERIEQVNRMKLELFTNISHDFRTPLTLIVGPLQRMIREKVGDSFIQKQHEIMYRNANMLLQLINQLLDFRKSESGKLVLYASKSNIVTVCKNVKMAFDDLAKTKNIDFVLTTTDEKIETWFDKVKMKKILFNLLSNAFKYNDGDNSIIVDISTTKKNDIKDEKHIIIRIINYGEVIPKDKIGSIFERFYRTEQNSIQAGTGIGLALTKNLVELHHGTISVTSSIEDGTCFEVSLPIGRAYFSDDECINTNEEFLNEEHNIFIEEKLISKNKEKSKVDNADSSSLLIVEDNIDVRNFIKSIFINKYKIYEAGHGKEALSITKDTHIDLIISDVMMPEMDGFEFCNLVKSDITTSHIPVILLTAKTSATHHEKGYLNGADVYITKPFDANILDIRVKNLLQSRINLITKFRNEIILEPKELTVTSTDEIFLKKALGIVEANLSNSDFSIDIFISEMGMSRSVLYRKLKALTGQSITEFIRNIKLKRAGQLILNSDMNISEIAFDLGFNDLKYFRKSFQKLFNVLPSQYRGSKNTDANTNDNSNN